MKTAGLKAVYHFTDFCCVFFFKAAVGKLHVLFIGITCGMSASFVAGQLDYCLQNLDRFTPVLIGFNPSYLAR